MTEPRVVAMKPTMLPKWIRSRLRRSLCAVVVGLLLASSGLDISAHAADWMYRRSYFSHTLPPDVTPDYPVPTSRSAYRTAWVGTHPGFAVRGGYRWNRVQLRSGNSVDTTILRSNRFEVLP